MSEISLKALLRKKFLKIAIVQIHLLEYDKWVNVDEVTAN